MQRIGMKDILGNVGSGLTSLAIANSGAGVTASAETPEWGKGDWISFPEGKKEGRAAHVIDHYQPLQSISCTLDKAVSVRNGKLKEDTGQKPY